MNSNWSYSPETVKLGVDLCDLDLWALTLTFCMDVTFVIGNNFWKFRDDTMMGTSLVKKVWQADRQTDGQTEISVLRAAWSQLKILNNHLITISDTCISIIWLWFVMGNFNKKSTRKWFHWERERQFCVELVLYLFSCFCPCPIYIVALTR